MSDEYTIENIKSMDAKVLMETINGLRFMVKKLTVRDIQQDKSIKNKLIREFIEKLQCEIENSDDESLRGYLIDIVKEYEAKLKE